MENRAEQTEQTADQTVEPSRQQTAEQEVESRAEQSGAEQSRADHSTAEETGRNREIAKQKAD